MVIALITPANFRQTFPKINIERELCYLQFGVVFVRYERQELAPEKCEF